MVKCSSRVYKTSDMKNLDYLFRFLFGQCCKLLCCGFRRTALNPLCRRHIQFHLGLPRGGWNCVTPTWRGPNGRRVRVTHPQPHPTHKSPMHLYECIWGKVLLMDGTNVNLHCGSYHAAIVGLRSSKGSSFYSGYSTSSTYVFRLAFIAAQLIRIILAHLYNVYCSNLGYYSYRNFQSFTNSFDY